MTHYNATSNWTGAGAYKTLADNDSLTVFQGVKLETTSAGNTIHAYGSNIDIDVLGTVTGPDDGFPAIWLGRATDSNNHLVVRAGATVDDVGMGSPSSSIENAGAIRQIYFGVEDSAAAKQCTIVNSGTISDDYAIYRSEDPGKLVVTNTGTITGTTYAYSSWSDTRAVDIIKNSGTIDGSIDFGAGNDVYDGRKGRMENSLVSGEAGKDRLLGGKETESFYGGAGKDTMKGGGDWDILNGARGRDTLTGGKGADDFDYYTVADSRGRAHDLITDFKRIQGDTIGLTFIDANTKKSEGQAFKFIADDDFHGKAGELRFEIEDGHTWVYGDVDGNGKADFIIEFDDVIKFKGTDFEL